MPSAATSFTLGIVTATAIAAGFAGTFMESVGTQRSTNALLRERAKPVVVAAPSNTVPQPPPAAAAPSTSGFALPPAQMTTRLPSSSVLPAVAMSKPTEVTIDGTAVRPPWPKQPADQVKPKQPRKHHSRPAKRPREMSEDGAVTASRDRRGFGGLFGIFR